MCRCCLNIIMDELAFECQRKLETFRIKELKDVLTHIGGTKQGKKQVLVERIMSFLQSPINHPPEFMTESSAKRMALRRKELARVIDVIYRGLRGQSAHDLATTVVGGRRPVSNVALVPPEPEPPPQESTTRCPCGSSVESGTMIQCDDSNCMVWQHLSCVLIPETEEAVHEIPSRFYCELCRIQLGDPFSVGVAHPVLPFKMNTSIIGSDGSSSLQNVERTFTLSRKDLELYKKPNHDIQIWSLLLNDKMGFRMHWPLHVDVRVNGARVRVVNRPGHQALGKNGRDDGARIGIYLREGTNHISVSASDRRPFCIGIRVIRRLNVDQILSLIPSQSGGETFDLALARVQRCIGGGKTAGDGAGSDSDLEFVSECVSTNLRCPMSGLRINIAARFRPCTHMGCFDLRTFVELCERTRKWQCPICLTNYILGDLIIDPFFTRICSAMEEYGEEVTEVELKPSGAWRPKRMSDQRLPEKWHFPDGTVIEMDNVNEVDKVSGAFFDCQPGEGLTDECGVLKIGIKRTLDGSWQVNKIRRVCSGSDSMNVDDEMQGPGGESLGISKTGTTTANVFQMLENLQKVEASSFGNHLSDNNRQLGATDVIILSDTDDECTSLNQRADRLALSGVTVQENGGGASSNASTEASNHGAGYHQHSTLTCQSSTHLVTTQSQQPPMEMDAEALLYLRTSESFPMAEHQGYAPDETQQIELQHFETSRTRVGGVSIDQSRNSRNHYDGEFYSFGSVEARENSHHDVLSDSRWSEEPLSMLHGHRAVVRPRSYFRVDSDSE